MGVPSYRYFGKETCFLKVEPIVCICAHVVKNRDPPDYYPITDKDLLGVIRQIRNKGGLPTQSSERRNALPVGRSFWELFGKKRRILRWLTEADRSLASFPDGPKSIKGLGMRRFLRGFETSRHIADSALEATFSRVESVSALDESSLMSR